MNLFEFISPFYFWTLLSHIFALFELGAPGLFVCLAFSASSALVAIISVFFTNLIGQAITFLVLGVGIFLALKSKLLDWKYTHQTTPDVTSNTKSLIGKYVHLEQPLNPGECGYAKVEKELWSCKNDSQIILTNDIGVIVVSIQGNTLILKSKELS